MIDSNSKTIGQLSTLIRFIYSSGKVNEDLDKLYDYSLNELYWLAETIMIMSKYEQAAYKDAEIKRSIQERSNSPMLRG